MGALRIGKITFTNILPIYYFFHAEKFQGEVELIPQVPAQLNQGMAEGTIDMGPMSSFEYGRNHHLYEVMSGLSISSLGKVRSIFLFSKKPIEELQEAKIALSNFSATSVNLLRIILEKFYGFHPCYETVQSTADLNKMTENADACLLIGDDALLASWNHNGYYMYDLGELWYRQTGLWMVYAVWAVRKDVLTRDSERLSRIHEEFLASKERGFYRLSEIIKEVGRGFGGTDAFWHEYYTGLSYDFKEDHKRGLEYYFRCAAELGLLRQPVEVEVWDGAKYKYS